MFRGCWLLADLDGTLVATPHKAHGHYTPLSESPCFQPVKEWLLGGGNLCVVTTADRRVVDQVFVPLQGVLREIEARAHERHAAAARAVQCEVNEDDGAKDGVRDLQTSNLLLSLYTGAVLYRCSAEHGVVEVSGYCAQQLDQATPAAPAGGAIDSGAEERAIGTCMDEKTYQTLLPLLQDVFLQFAEDVLRGRRRDLFVLLSKRYQHMWHTLRRHLHKRYDTERQRAKEGAPTRRFRDLERFLDDEMEWQVQYLRRRRALLTRIGIIRKEVLDRPGTAVKGNRHTYQAMQAAQKQQKKQQKSATPSTRNGAVESNNEDADTMKEDVDALEVREIQDDLKGPQQTDDPSQASDAAPAASAAGRGRGRIAQVIIVGVPLRCYDEYFGIHHDYFVKELRVQPIPQPNSVVFAKFGVGKGTCVEYLNCAPARGRVGLKALPFQGAARLQRCVGLGDNPHSADRELCMNPHLTFVSLEAPTAPRRSEAKASSPSGNAATDVGAAQLSATAAPRVTTSVMQAAAAALAHHTDHLPLVDLSLYASHMLHVGREEDGCAEFLAQLIALLRERHKSAQGDNALPYWVPCEGAAGELCVPDGMCVNEQIFQQCVKIAAASAKMTHLHRGGSLPVPARL